MPIELRKAIEKERTALEKVMAENKAKYNNRFFFKEEIKRNTEAIENLKSELKSPEKVLVSGIMFLLDTSIETPFTKLTELSDEKTANEKTLKKLNEEVYDICALLCALKVIEPDQFYREELVQEYIIKLKIKFPLLDQTNLLFVPERLTYWDSSVKETKIDSVRAPQIDNLKFIHSLKTDSSVNNDSVAQMLLMIEQMIKKNNTTHILKLTAVISFFDAKDFNDERIVALEKLILNPSYKELDDIFVKFDLIRNQIMMVENGWENGSHGFQAGNLTYCMTRQSPDVEQFIEAIKSINVDALSKLHQRLISAPNDQISNDNNETYATPAQNL